MSDDINLLAHSIRRVREKHGEYWIPLAVSKAKALSTVGMIRRQYRDLKRSEAGMDLSEVSKLVCWAHEFVPDPEENWWLQYAYQLVAMDYFQARNLERREEESIRQQSLDALVAAVDGRE